MTAIDQNSSRWRAITARDPEAHFSFLYGVRTTKIYCRPTCTARVARRANVVYFDTQESAEAEGFRPCVKCKPHESFIGHKDELVLKTLGLIWDNKNDGSKKRSMKGLADELSVTPSYLCRTFKKTMGCTLSEYVQRFESEQSIENLVSAQQSGGARAGSEYSIPSTASIASEPRDYLAGADGNSIDGDWLLSDAASSSTCPGEKIDPQNYVAIPC
ncbi:Bifunctional transcriptional activator/DNA repair enzyme Ada [Cercospora beticola]|uniref:Bifunctional transcriptional activator/DNA repair enzyme Ada n=1 Tax=Cercospora beticola TaxID=122368 RepID=A0A2G5I3T0_CERBT|nr:Bifunctional transcriptional activator/DNA repair enzyme Ada [Cercospora beticola]PIA99467.1 Bifunctional transcriptional activator/DNA repair enzyme Ada [Cercospora beticola]WPB00664.1 hypothetical protein RHO25_005284 [Cercospora beticola]